MCVEIKRAPTGWQHCLAAALLLQIEILKNVSFVDMVLRGSRFFQNQSMMIVKWNLKIK
jgi:hypothetical protein